MKKRVTCLRALPVALWTALSATVYAAVCLYSRNADEFWFSLSQGLSGVWEYFGVAALGLFLLTAFLRGKVQRYALAAVFALGLSVVLQMTFLNADYGVLDGKSIDWSSYTLYGIVNTVTWAAIFIICITVSHAKCFPRLIVLLPLLLLVLEGAHMAHLVATLPEKSNTEALQLTSTGLDTVGERNLIILVPDSTDADDFTVALAEHPELQDTLDGFTFYKNAMGLSDPTKYGLPALLTGEVHRQAVSYTDFIHEAYTTAPLFSTLKTLGWDSRVFTESRYIDMEAAGINNAEQAEASVSDEAGLTRDFMQLCAFCYAPHFLKPQLWMYGSVFGQYKQLEGAPVYQENDPAYAVTLAENGLKNVGGQAFRTIHMTGMHPPYTMGTDCTYHAEGVTAEEQMQGVLTILVDYINELKSLGVYDTSDILILADHGTETVHRPLLLLKRQGETGTLKISEAPVSYADLNATYLKLLGQPTADAALWEIDEGTSRTRLYYHENSTNNMFNYYQYTTEDSAPDFEELVPTGVVYHGDTGGEAAPYTLGTTLYFDLRATGRPYEVSGFSSADHMSTWTSGDTGEIRLPLANLPQSDYVTVDMSFLSVMLGSQRLIVSCGGETVYDDTVTAMSVSFTVASSLVTDGVLDLQFAYPDAISHLDAGKSSDTRKVAFALVSMTVRDGE